MNHLYSKTILRLLSAVIVIALVLLVNYAKPLTLFYLTSNTLDEQRFSQHCTRSFYLVALLTPLNNLTTLLPPKSRKKDCFYVRIILVADTLRKVNAVCEQITLLLTRLYTIK